MTCKIISAIIRVNLRFDTLHFKIIHSIEYDYKFDYW